MTSTEDRALLEMSTLAELFDLEVLEEPRHGAFEPIMIVRGIPGDRDERVLVGFLENCYFAATRGIPGVSTTYLGHGPWLYRIDI